MYRGTTPTFNFTLPFEASQLTAAYITFSQRNTVVLEKTLDECTYEGEILTVTLAEEETLKFKSDSVLEIQIRCAIGETKMASNIMTATVGRILKDGVI